MTTRIAARAVVPVATLRRAGAPGCYILLGAALLALLAVTARNGEWVSDSWIHAATLTEVARHPWHPLEPLTGEDVPFAYFSPWAMVLGWAMRLTGAGVWSVLTVAGLLGTALLLAAWYRLVRAVTAAAWAPVLSLLLLLLLWGYGGWFWSGFFGLGTMSVGFAWPSVLAGAAWFETWRTALRLGAASRARRIAVFTVLPGLILLVHPFTAVLAAVSVGVTLAGRLRRHRRAVLDVAVASVVSAGLAVLWPWISVPSMFGDAAAFNAIHAPLYRYAPAQFVLLALTVPALLVRLRADRADPLAWTAALCAAGVGAGAVTHAWSLGRFGPGAALAGQLALGALLARAAARRRSAAGGPVRRPGSVVGTAGTGGPVHQPGPASGTGDAPGMRVAGRVLAGLTVVALLVGGYANAWAVARALPGPAARARAEKATHAQVPYPDLRWIARYVRTDDVAVANFWYVRRELPTYRLRLVATPWPSPAVPDEARRRRDQARIVGSTPTGPAERARLLARYRVRWILWYPLRDAPRWSYPGARLVACGPAGITLLRVDRSAAGAPSGCRTPGQVY